MMRLNVNSIETDDGKMDIYGVVRYFNNSNPWSWSIPMVPAQLSVLLQQNWGVGNETCGMDYVFPPDDF